MGCSLPRSCVEIEQKSRRGRPPKAQNDGVYHWTTTHRNDLYHRVLGPYMPGANDRQIINFGGMVSEFNLYRERHVNNPVAIAMPVQRLKAQLGRNWYTLIAPMVDINGPYRFNRQNRTDKTQNYTREFVVKPEFADAINDAFCRHEWEPSRLIRSDGRRTYSTDNVMVGYRKKGRHGWLNVPVKYQIKSVQRYIDIYTDWLNAVESGIAPTIAVDEYQRCRENYRAIHADMEHGLFIHPWRRWIESRLISAREVNAVVNAEGSDGLYRQTFAQANNKPRWTGQGPASLQTVPRDLRYTALAGCWQYDIECCHHAILQWFAQQAGIKCPTLDGYVANRDVLRNKLAAALGHHDTDTIKKALLIIVYGGRLQLSWSESDNVWALRELLGEQGQLILSEQPEFRSLLAELRKIFKYIIETHQPRKGHKGAIQNVLEQLLPPTYENDMGAIKKTNEAQKVAFILQAIECQAMMAMIDASMTPLLPVHDGIVTRSQVPDTSVLIENMKEKTGITFRIEEKQIEAPQWLV